MDNNTLLMRVLKIHYKNRLQILDDALKLIKEYSCRSDSTHNEYDQVQSSLINILNDLPSEILKYFLSMVPLPKNKINLTTNKREFDNIRDILLSYLKQDVPPLIPLVKNAIKTDNSEIKLPSKSFEFKMFENTLKSLKRPVFKQKRVRGYNREPKKLTDICAEFVILNHATLTQDYTNVKDYIWKILNKNVLEGENLNQLYEFLRDLNKKLKWLRLMISDNIPEEIIREEYGKSDIFIKERHLEELLRAEPFIMQSELKVAIHKFME